MAAGRFVVLLSAYVVHALKVDASLTSSVGVKATAAVIDPLAEHVSELEASLAKLRAETEAKVEAEKVAYEANLTAQERENRGMERKNVQFAAQIRALDHEIAQLRAEAGRLAQRNAKIRADISYAQGNISTAREFAADTLNSSAESPHNTPELAILAEIALEDEQQRDAQARESRLHEVRAAETEADMKSVLLQLGSRLQLIKHARKQSGKLGAKKAPHDLLHTLSSSLDSLAVEQNETLTKFKAMFEKEYQAGQQRGQDLVRELDRLNATWSADVQIKSRLVTAVGSLTEANSALESTRASLASFLRHTAARPAPSAVSGSEVASLLAVAGTEVPLHGGQHGRRQQGAQQAKGGVAPGWISKFATLRR